MRSRARVRMLLGMHFQTNPMPPRRRATRLLGAALTAATLLAAPAGASAAEQVGSDFQQVPFAQPVGCAGGAPCTLALDMDGFSEVAPAIGTVVTSFKAQLSPGAQVRPRLLRRNDDGSFSAYRQGDVATGSAAGGIQTFPTHLVVGDTSRTALAVDLLAGQLAAAPDPYDVLTFARFQPVIGDGGAALPAATERLDLMLSASTEVDYDGDGLGDETQDPCVGTCEPPSQPPVDPPVQPPATPTDPGTGGGPGGGGPADAGGGGGGDQGGSGQGGTGTGRFTIEPRAILRGGSAGQTGYISIYAENAGKVDVTGTLQVKLGKRALKGTGEIDLEWDEHYSWGLFRLTARDRATLLRKGKLKATAIARVKPQVGKAYTVRQPITILRGGATGFDGTYRGPGPVVIEVERGAIFAFSYPLNLFCSRTKRFEQRAFTVVPGFPTLVGKDGSFSAKGSSSADTITYRGKLTKRGTGRGYLSLFRTRIYFEGSGITSEQCFDTRDWAVRRDR